MASQTLTGLRYLSIFLVRFAGVAQLVEHFLAKEDVASSSLVTRSPPKTPRPVAGVMPDFIEIHGLLVAAKVGVPDLERSVPQRLEIDLVLTGDFRDLGDDLSRTTDYAAVAEWIRRTCAQSEFRLIESLTDHLAGGVLESFPAVAKVALKIRKFILPGTDHVAVGVERERTRKTS